MHRLKLLLDKHNAFATQYRSLHLMLLFGTLLGIVLSLINMFTAPSFPTIVLPMSVSLFCLLLLYYSSRGKRSYLAKISFILFLDFVYFPIGWITSAGTLSSMPYYSILFLIVTFLLMEYRHEYILPILYMIVAIFLMYAEVRWPGLLATYQRISENKLTISFHYAVVAVFISVIFITFSQQFTDVQKKISRPFKRDELTGLHTRTYGLRELQKAFASTNKDTSGFTLILLSIEGLKEINERFNTFEGDQVVLKLVGVLQRSTRTNDVCTRYDGNLFMVLLNQSDPKQVANFISRIKGAFNMAFNKKYDGFQPKLLVGTAGFDYNDISGILKSAEADLETSKHQFRRTQ